MGDGHQQQEQPRVLRRQGGGGHPGHSRQGGHQEVSLLFIEAVLWKTPNIIILSINCKAVSTTYYIFYVALHICSKLSIS